MKPASILTFERLYLGSIVIWLLDKALFWSSTQAAMARTPQFAGNPQFAAILGPIALVVTLIYAASSFGLWHAVAHRASNVGKWLVIVTEAVGLLFALATLTRLVRGQVPNPADAALSIVSTILAVVAAAFLLQRDAGPWFGRGDGGEAFR